MWMGPSFQTRAGRPRPQTGGEKKDGSPGTVRPTWGVAAGGSGEAEVAEAGGEGVEGDEGDVAQGGRGVASVDDRRGGDAGKEWANCKFDF